MAEHIHFTTDGEAKKTALLPTYLGKKTKTCETNETCTERFKDLEKKYAMLKEEIKELRLLVETGLKVRNDRITNCKLNGTKCGTATLIGDLIHLSLDIHHDGKIELFPTTFYKLTESEIKIETESGDLDCPIQEQNNHYYLIIPNTENNIWPLKLELTL
jgi:hypothetical protein